MILVRQCAHNYVYEPSKHLDLCGLCKSTRYSLYTVKVGIIPLISMLVHYHVPCTLLNEVSSLHEVEPMIWYSFVVL
jgi:hypothetical protein